MMENPRLLFVYVVWGDLSKSGGIVRKLMQQSVACKECGIPIDFLCINEEKNFKSENLEFRRIEFRSKLSRWYTIHFNKCKILSPVFRNSTYPIFILRYPGVDPGIRKCLYQRKIISEHHSLEKREYLSQLLQSLFSFQLIHSTSLLLAYINEVFWGPSYRQDVYKIIGVTSEITQFECSLAPKNEKDSRTIGNGLNTADFPYSGFKVIKAGQLVLVMSIGRYVMWHGLERLMKSINAYQGQEKIILNIIGAAINLPGLKDPHELRFIDGNNDEWVKTVFSHSNIAISTLALYRKGINMAVPLKSREYMARGIPFVYGYLDEDLSRIDPEHKFSMMVSNSGELIDMDKVIQFAKQVSANPEQISQEMRQLASQHLSHAGKMKQLYEFATG